MSSEIHPIEALSKQYETFLAKGQVLDEQGMPLVGGVKMDTGRHNPVSRHAARRILSSARPLPLSARPRCLCTGTRRAPVPSRRRRLARLLTRTRTRSERLRG